MPRLGSLTIFQVIRTSTVEKAYSFVIFHCGFVPPAPPPPPPPLWIRAWFITIKISLICSNWFSRRKTEQVKGEAALDIWLTGSKIDHSHYATYIQVSFRNMHVCFAWYLETNIRLNKLAHSRTVFVWVYQINTTTMFTNIPRPLTMPKWHGISNNVVFWQVWTQTSLCSLLLKI